MKTILQSLLVAVAVALVSPSWLSAQETSGTAADSADAAKIQNTVGDAAQDAVQVPVQDATDSNSPQAATTKPASTDARAALTPTRSLGQSGELRFQFAGTNWDDVLHWFAEEADLALQLDQAPLGSWTFSDPTRSYTVSQSLDIINLALMKRGYSLVRRGRMLQVIDLEVDNADKLISELAELVQPDQLEERGNSDIVSCVFPLGSMSPDAAKEELALMVGPWGRVIVLESARQVKVTEAASKLIAIRELLKSAAMADTNVIEIVLEHRAADEILELARPLLGLDAGENSNDEIRISVGLFGDRIFAAGLPGKTGLLERIVEKADQPLATPESGEGTPVSPPLFRTHIVRSADIATVFDVLQTLLAGTPEARIAIDPKNNAIVAWARPETHEMIDQTIAEMEGSGQDFKVVDLKRLDPAQALLTINKFFGVTEEGGEGPIVDGDPATGKLWIRGTTEQIALVEKLLSELEGKDSLGVLGDKVRLLPYTGRAAEDALNQIESLWPVTGRRNRIRTIAPSRANRNEDDGGIRQRRVLREPDARNVSPQRPDDAQSRASADLTQRYHWVSQPGDEPTSSSDADPSGQQPDSNSNETSTDDPPSTTINVGGADIIVQFTPAGMIIASEDTEALDAFQSLMESFATPSGAASDLPTIIWLKYIKADVAAELISSVLGGAEGSLSSTLDSVTSGFGGGMLGLLGGGGGGDTSSAKSVLTSSGSVNIVPDARLNALIIQANPIDLQMIELILERVDIQESPEDIETSSKPALIPVIYQDAKDVADVVKSVFGERIAGAQSAGGGKKGGQPSPQDFIAALRGGGRGGKSGGDAPTSEASKISVAVDAKSNSLVVIATPQDFAEVRTLVEALDQSSMMTEETIVTYSTKGSVNPEVMRAALESILGTEAKSTSDSNSPSGEGSKSTASSESTSRNASEIQQRIEAFRARFGGGAGGGARGGFGARGGGGAPGGGRPTGGRPGGARGGR